MSTWPQCALRYDGTFAGFLTCVGESFRQKTYPFYFLPPGAEQITLYPLQEIPSDPALARAVYRALETAVSPAFRRMMTYGFLTCLPQRERSLFDLIYLAFHHAMPQDPTDDRIHYMLPTAEAALASVYRDEILTEADLPKKFFAYTPCFRREAGSARAEERGMVRGHQFNKVEMFQFTRPEDSDDAFDELVTKAENLVKGLGFHFRTVKLAAGDCSASMARTYDIEIQIPSMQGYKEVSSVSNARDYQARRGNMRFRRESTGKPEFLHTLNGSGLATSRIFPAMVEQNQLKDGSVKIPAALRPYMGGKEVLTPKQ